MDQPTLALLDRFRALQAGTPGLRARDAARQLGVSECELVFANPAARRLADDDWSTLLQSVASLGPVMALARNEACVHELTGDYRHVQIEGKVGLAINPVVDLRFFLFHWRYAFALEESTPRGPRRSLQFFDRYGQAIQKVYLTADSDVAAFEALRDRFAIDKGEAAFDTRPAPEPEQPDSAIDAAAFQADWLALKDVHEFHPLLKQYGLTRPQAFRLAPAGQAWRVRADAVETLLRRAAATGLPVMVFAGNGSIIQIHTGPVKEIRTVGDWLNILDPQFNLHLCTNDIAEAWVTHKPGDNGVVTSLELFNDAGESIVTFFGERKPGRPERPEWRQLVCELAPEEADHA